MKRGLSMHRRTALSSLLALGAAGAGFGPAHAQGKSALNLAMVAEPPTLDIQSTPADLVCIIMQHVYEPLFTFDAKASLVPMLAEIGLPVVSGGRPLGTPAPFVNADNFTGALEAARHLASLGRKRIGTVAGPKDMAVGADRLSGFKRGLSEVKLSCTTSTKI